MTKTTHSMRTSVNIDPEEIWYAPHHKLRTKTTAELGKAVARWVMTGEGLDHEPDEQELFVALHYCGYQAARQPRTGKPLTRAHRRRWAKRWQAIREYIVEQNLGLVYSMISKFNFQNLDDDDLLSDGMFGLTRAVDRFNPWKGFRFSTYACNVIARSLMRRGKQTSRYNRLFPVQHDVEFEQPTRMPDTETELYIERLNRALEQNLGELTEIESKILAKRFLSESDRRLTFREIGDSIGLSKERVRQIQNIALDKLRDVLDTDPVLQ